MIANGNCGLYSIFVSQFKKTVFVGNISSNWDEHKLKIGVLTDLTGLMEKDYLIEAGDLEGVRRLTEYIARCPFSLARIISVNTDGKVIYRAIKKDALPYPEQEQDLFRAGIPRNFQIYDPLEFLAMVTQHIPKPRSHQIRYYGTYSNKNRGQKEKREKAEAQKAEKRKGKQLMNWAQLIQLVYETDPLSCPECGGRMKIISFIEEREVIRRILKHARLWKEPLEEPPKMTSPPEKVEYEEGVDYMPDYSIFDDVIYEDWQRVLKMPLRNYARLLDFELIPGVSCFCGRLQGGR